VILLTSEELGQRLQRLATEIWTDPEDALVRVGRTARRRRARNRTGGVLVLALALAVMVVTPTVLNADRLGSPVGGTDAVGGSGNTAPPRVPKGYVYQPTWLPETVRRISASEESAGPPVPAGQWSERILAAETPCPPSCSVLSVRVLRGQPRLDAARQARDYAGQVIGVHGRKGVLLPAIAGMRDSAALVWTAPSGLLVVVEGSSAGTPVPEREVLAVAAGLRLPDASNERLGKPQFTRTGYQVLDDKEADLDPTVSTPAPFPRMLRHQFSTVAPATPPASRPAPQGGEVAPPAAEPNGTTENRHDLAALSPPVLLLEVRRGLPGEELGERAAADRCASSTRVRGRAGWLLAGTSLIEAPVSKPAGGPCSRDREVGLVWTEHDDVTIQVVVDASIDAVDPNGVDLLRRFVGALRAR
jgi:hypothetical protein